MVPLTAKTRSQLRKAKKAVDKVRVAQIRALSVYRNALRLAAREGGSVREIAQEVGLSHQRVHQILQAGCDLCERDFTDVAQLVQAGPRLTICNHCIARATKVLAGQRARGTPKLRRPTDIRRASCASCGLPAHRVPGLLRANENVDICDDCWRLAQQIIDTHGVDTDG